MTSQTRTKKKNIAAGSRLCSVGLLFSVCLNRLSDHCAGLAGLGCADLAAGLCSGTLGAAAVAGAHHYQCVGLGRYRGSHYSGGAGDFPNDADYLVVLGAGVNGRTPSLSLLNRLTAAEAWLQDNPNGKAILSGGQGPGEDISEAGAMYQWLTEHGIAAERLYKEETSATTRENFQYSAELLRQLNGGKLPEKVAVLSSEYHLYRAKYLARQAGLEPLGVPAKTTLPVLRLNYFLREGWRWGGFISLVTR